MPQVLDRELQNAIDRLNNKQKKAVLGIVNAFAEEEKEPVYDHWKDKDFVAEMDRRYNEYKSGKVKLISLEEVEKKARDAAAKIRTKKAS